MQRFQLSAALGLLALIATLALPAHTVTLVAHAQATPASDLVIACAPDSGSGKITGTVVGPGALPLQYVLVTAYTRYGYRAGTAYTNSTGAYTISGLITGGYLLHYDPRSSSTNAAAEWYEDAITPTAAIPVIVDDGNTTTSMNAELVPGAQFGGQVLNEDGIGIQHAQVQVYNSQGNNVANSYTDASGVFTTTPGLTAGSYRLFVQAPGGQPYLSEYYNNKPTLETAEVLTVTTPGLVSGINAVLARGAQISGRVTSAVTGLPLPSIGVSVYGENGGDFAYTDATGVYTATGLGSGSYQVSFGPIFESQNLIRVSQRVTVTAPSLLTGVDAALEPGAVLIGRVTTPDGTPIKSVNTYVSSQDADFGDYFYTDATGVYTATGLSSGSYRVFFRRDGFISEVYNDKPDFQAADIVTVTAPITVSGIDAVLTPGGAVTGVITDATNGAPVKGVFVEVLDQEGQRVETAFSDATGAYTTSATLASGSYKVVFNPDDRNASCNYALEYYDDKPTLELSSPISVTAALTTTNINAALTRGSILFGRVSDGTSGAALERLNVTVYDASGARVASGRTTFIGGYLTTPALPTGNYRVRFSDYDGGYIDEYYNDTFSLESATVLSVTAPLDLTGIDASLTAGGTISGRVIAGDTGEPLPYTDVIVYNAAGQPVAYSYVQEDGNYNVDAGLPTGDYRVEFLPYNAEGEEASITQGGATEGKGYQRSFYPNKLSLGEATPVRVTAPNRTTGIDVVLRRGNYLSFISGRN